MNKGTMPTKHNVPDEVLDAIHEGARRYNDGAYWDAHEAWEDAWHALQNDGLEKEAHVTQGLILATAAFENLQRGKPNGFRVQAAKALQRLRQHPTTATRLGVTNEDTFTETLLTLYLDAQAQRAKTLNDLPIPPPKLTIEP